MVEQDKTQEASAAHSPFSEVPIEIVVSVGRSRPLVRDLLNLKPDSVLPLDRKIADPVELYVGDKLIATGELEEAEEGESGQLAVRLTAVADLQRSL